MSWYKTGTVTVTNGDAVVTGSGMLWTLATKPGDIFTTDGLTIYEVASVDSDTQITLASLYQGTTNTGIAYSIIRNFSNNSNAQVAEKMTGLAEHWGLREKEMVDWLGGTVDGGPAGDGKYPVTDWWGNTALVECPAKQTDRVDGEVNSTLIYKNDAEAAATAAAASEINAATSETNAAISETNAATSETNVNSTYNDMVTAYQDLTAVEQAVTDAQTSETNAAISESNAISGENKAHEWAEGSEDVEVETGEYSAHHWANKSSASATAAATSETNAASSETNAATSELNTAAFESNAATSETNAAASESAAAASENQAYLWANEAHNVEVSVGEYSAYHWAQDAKSYATGQLIYRGSWDASTGVYPTDSIRGDYYQIDMAGTIDGVEYRIGDSMIANGGDETLSSGWDKIDNSGAVTSVAGKTGNVTLTKADVGLGNVENVTLSTATWVDMGIDPTDVTKADVGLASVENKALSTATWVDMGIDPTDVTKADVGLGNVENIALSTATWADMGIDPTDVTKADVGLGNVPNEDATNPANLDQAGATIGQVLTWNGAQYAPADSGGSGGGVGVGQVIFAPDVGSPAFDNKYLRADDSLVAKTAWPDLDAFATANSCYQEPVSDEYIDVIGTVSASFNAVAGNGNTAVAVGYSGAIARSSDAGVTWSEVADSRTVTIEILNDVGSDGTNFVAVGNEGTMLRSTDDGVSWQTISLGLTYDLKGITFDGVAFNVVGEWGTIRRSTDGGASWSTVSFPTTGYLYSYSTNGSQIVISGSYAIYYSHDGGGTWTQADDTNIDLSNFWYECANDGTNFVAVEGYGRIIYSTDGGVNWVESPDSDVIAANGLKGIGLDGGNFVAVGADGVIIHSNDGGINWTESTSSGVITATADFRGVGSNGTDFWVVGNQFILYKSGGDSPYLKLTAISNGSYVGYIRAEV